MRYGCLKDYLYFFIFLEYFPVLNESKVQFLAVDLLQLVILALVFFAKINVLLFCLFTISEFNPYVYLK